MMSKIIKLLLVTVACFLLIQCFPGDLLAYAHEISNLSTAVESNLVVDKPILGQKEWEYLEKFDAIDDSKLFEESFKKFLQASKNEDLSQSEELLTTMASEVGKIIKRINKIPVYGVDPHLVSFSAKNIDFLSNLQYSLMKGSMLLSQAKTYEGFGDEVGEFTYMITGSDNIISQEKFELRSKIKTWTEELLLSVSDAQTVQSLGLQVSAILSQKYERDFSRFFQS
jgi:hypothetical protein